MDIKELSQRVDSLSDEKKQEISSIVNKPDTSLKNSKAAAHNLMCRSTFATLEECFSKAGVNMKEADKFPESCADVAVNHMECAVLKRDYAYSTAQNLAGKAATDRVFPKYEESKKKALDLIELYKNNAAGGKLNKDTPFWG